MPNKGSSTFQFFWKEQTLNRDFRAGVSLHSHTMYSEESLDILPRYTGKIPILSRTLDKNVDYNGGFWTPPLSPRQAHRLEEKQIQRRLQLPALVSLTDHDNIQAGMLLRVLDRFRHAPISTEWTIPFGPTFFHLGIHNLPPSQASGIMAELEQFTSHPDPEHLGSKLALLNSYPDCLLVLNHPLWDEKGVGYDKHFHALTELLKLHGGEVHALEVNGLRSWPENQRVIRLAQQSEMTLVSGGDRHGREPNAILNLTAGATLLEFIHELRYRHTSHLIFMPQYREPLNMRTMQTVVDVLRDYPEACRGRRTWQERVFYRQLGSQEAVPISSIFPDGNGPTIFKIVTMATKFAQLGLVRSALRFAFEDRASVWSASATDLPAFRSLEIDREAAI